jgi:putative transposon-encoded protein
MRRTMRWFTRALMIAAAGALLFTSLTPAASAQRVRGGFFVRPVYSPFYYGYGYGYPYPYAYGPGDAPANIGYVQIETHHLKDASLYVDGGYAAKADKAKKFAIRPGTHDIELRDASNHTFFQERVTVLIGKSTKVDVPNQAASNPVMPNPGVPN